MKSNYYKGTCLLFFLSFTISGFGQNNGDAKRTFTFVCDQINLRTRYFLSPDPDQNAIIEKASKDNTLFQFDKWYPDLKRRNKSVAEITKKIDDQKQFISNEFSNNVGKSEFKAQLSKFITFCLNEAANFNRNLQIDLLKSDLEKFSTQVLSTIADPPIDPNLLRLQQDISILNDNLTTLRDSVCTNLYEKNRTINKKVNLISIAFLILFLLSLLLSVYLIMILKGRAPGWLTKIIPVKVSSTNEVLTTETNAANALNNEDIEKISSMIKEEIAKIDNTNSAMSKSLSLIINTLRKHNLVDDDSSTYESKQEEIKKKPEEGGKEGIFYLEIPDSRGVFDNSRSSIFMQDEKFFILTLTTKDKNYAHFRPVDDEILQQRLLKDFTATLKPVCKIRNNQYTGKRIVLEKEGMVKLRGDKWEMTEKCEISIY